MQSRCFQPRKSYGFLATTLPFSQTYIGVQYIRAVFCASFAARRKARPTPAAKLGGRVGFACVFGFINLSPVAARAPNCRTPPSCRPMADRCAESFPSLLRICEERPPAEHIVVALMHSRGDSPQRQSKGTKLKIHDVDAVAGTLPRLKPVHIGEPA
jgi:hypothetical protein